MAKPRLKMHSFCSGPILKEWKRWAWVCAHRRSSEDNYYDICCHFVGCIGEIIVASIFPMCEFSTYDSCDGNRTDNCYDTVLRLRHSDITIDVKTILDENYRISTNNDVADEIADFMILVFVDLVGDKFRIRGFSSRANYLKHVINDGNGFFLHKEHMQDFKEFFSLVLQDYASSGVSMPAALGTVLTRQQMRNIRDTILGKKKKSKVDVTLESQWEKLRKPTGDD